MPRRAILIRHGETEWTLSGQHTGTTDLPLTENGQKQARRIRDTLQHGPFDAVLCSPLQRARQTCALAGLEPSAHIDSRLVEWNYGDYEGLTTEAIQQTNPHWTIFKDGAPHGESPQAVQKRAQDLLSFLSTIPGDSVLISHGHFLRALTTVWLGLPIEAGSLFFLSPASVSILGFEREQPAILLWNQS